jgi:hypothetical protein
MIVRINLDGMSTRTLTFAVASIAETWNASVLIEVYGHQHPDLEKMLTIIRDRLTYADITLFVSRSTAPIKSHLCNVKVEDVLYIGKDWDD